MQTSLRLLETGSEILVPRHLNHQEPWLAEGLRAS